jgi:hypothetical protein
VGEVSLEHILKYYCVGEVAALDPPLTINFPSVLTFNVFFMWCAVVPLGLATALDINLSNVSLVFITVTFATMVRFYVIKIK